MIDSKNNRTRKNPTSPERNKYPVLPTLVAMGSACGLVANPAAALELGDIRVDSGLGQPLRASIAYALNPHETIAGNCIVMQPVAGGAPLPASRNLSITVTDRAILLEGRSAVREPLLEMRLAVSCPGTARIARDYTLMLDPPIVADRTPDQRVARLSDGIPVAPVTRQAAPETIAVAPATAQPEAAVRRRVPAERPARAAIEPESRYRVQPGDSLSEIAARVEGRSVGLPTAVDAIFVANPAAFIDNNPNRLMAGVTLEIPALTTAALASLAPESADESTLAAPPPVTTSAAYDVLASPDFAPLAAVEQPAEAIDAAATAEEIETPAPLAAPEAAPEPVQTVDEAVVETPATMPVVDIPDSSTTGNVEVAPLPGVVTPAAAASGGWWPALIGGTLAGLLIGWLGFGRRQPTAPRSTALAIHQQRMMARKSAPKREVDIDLTPSQTAAMTELDADLGAGTGLRVASEPVEPAAPPIKVAHTRKPESFIVTEELPVASPVADDNLEDELTLATDSIELDDVVPEVEDPLDSTVEVTAETLLEQETAIAAIIDELPDDLLDSPLEMDVEAESLSLEEVAEDATEEIPPEPTVEMPAASNDRAADLDTDDLDASWIGPGMLADVDLTSKLKATVHFLDDARSPADEDTSVNLTLTAQLPAGLTETAVEVTDDDDRDPTEKLPAARAS